MVDCDQSDWTLRDQTKGQYPLSEVLCQTIEKFEKTSSSGSIPTSD